MTNEALRLADSIHEMNNAAYMTAIANLNEKNRQQAERIAELEGELRQMTNNAADLAVHSQEVEAERDQLRAEVERYRPDALRYHAFFASALPVCFEGVEYYSKADCDAAIDRAIEAAKEAK